jgi:hypothetical protein
VTQLAAALHAALLARFPSLALATLAPLIEGGSAACYLRLRTPALPEPLAVCVLSQDLARFKVALVWTAPDAAGLGHRTLGGYPAILLKVRLVGLFERREIVLPDLPGAGFVRRDDGNLVERLSDLIATLLAAGAALAGAVEDTS